MFAHRFFGRRFYGQNYFGGVGGVIIPLVTPSDRIVIPPSENRIVIVPAEVRKV